MTSVRGAEAMLGLLVEPDSFQPWDADIVSGDPLGFSDTKPYPQRLSEAAARSGASESVLTGRGRVAGLDTALIVGEFGFLAGTMGLAAGERVSRAFERATNARLPVLGLPVSGGTRMQEGTLAFAQMAPVAAAAAEYRRGGLGYVVYLRDPTTGGVLASWGLLGQVTFAQPDALVGLTGPRVVEEVEGRTIPRHVQRSENLRRLGLVDDVVQPGGLAARYAAVLRATDRQPAPWSSPLDPIRPVSEPVDAWAAVGRSRRPDRPGIRQLLSACAEDITWLRGDDTGIDDPGAVAALARVAGVGAVIVGHDRPPGGRGASWGAAGHRKARRAMALAAELELPLVTVVDTPGAQSTPDAEEGGLAGEVARSLAAMAALEIPTLAVLLGEGTGASAIALLAADRVVAAENAWLSPLAPEGASVILHRSTDRAAELAAAQATVSTDLLYYGIADVVVPEPSDEAPGEKATAFTDRAAAVIAGELRGLLAADPSERKARRKARWRAPWATAASRSDTTLAQFGSPAAPSSSLSDDRGRS